MAMRRAFISSTCRPKPSATPRTQAYQAPSAASRATDRSSPSSLAAGESHLAHAACCLLFLLVHEIQGLGEDDRHPYLDVQQTTVAIAAEPAQVPWEKLPPYTEALDRI